MRPPDARAPSPADHGALTIAQTAAAFTRIADAIGGGKEAQLEPAFLHARRLSESASGDDQLDAEARQLFANLATAVEAWRSNWPRLGRQQDFRAAVTREAGQWARKLERLAQQTLTR